MAAPRDRRHIDVPETKKKATAFCPPQRDIPEKELPAPASRRAHGEALRQALDVAIAQAQERRRAAAVQLPGATPGLYVQMESAPGVPLNLESLEARRSKIELVAVQETAGAGNNKAIEHATVFVPEKKVGHFTKRLDKYSQDTPKQRNEQRHEDMLDRVGALRLANLRDLWTDAADVYPADTEVIWWEVWLRRSDGRELQRFQQFAAARNVMVSDRRIEFEDRIVVLARATPSVLAAALDLSGDLAEVRRAKEVAAFFIDLTPAEQADLARDLHDRTVPAGPSAPAACVLDTGVTRGHMLLAHSLAAEDANAVEPSWGAHDDGGGPEMAGHGTEMSGLALYGDLSGVLSAEPGHEVKLRHRLESVKILPPFGANDPTVYGAVTAKAAVTAEAAAPRRRRCFSLSITSRDVRDLGQPSSWSAAIDALAVGRSPDPKTQKLLFVEGEEPRRRLFVVSAGNVHDTKLMIDHLSRSDLEAVQDPGQAWNALTVGAFTEKTVITDPAHRGWKAVAPRGELSPYSSTSLLFGEAWPIKPDVVMEGGNTAHDGRTVASPVPELDLLTTHFRPADASFVHCWATSAATAQVSRMAAIVSAEYPTYWPETIRALLVHSARWTSAMQRHFDPLTSKKQRARLVRRYGFGVPSLERALRSGTDALTLVVQSTIRPFRDGRYGEMNVHELPWPVEELRDLGEAKVRLRVTLSYFVDPPPAPGRRGWRDRYRYASHQLRFHLRRPDETTEELRKRINKLDVEPEEDRPAAERGIDWFLGEARYRGSLHSDFWIKGTAADVAACGAIAIVPVTGWWKDDKKRDRSARGVRYSLIVSIETDAVEIDLWTPVATQVGLPVAATPVEL